MHLALGHLVYAVRDSGDGVPQDDRARLFDPFFTTKPPGAGTGTPAVALGRRERI